MFKYIIKSLLWYEIITKLIKKLTTHTFGVMYSGVNSRLKK